MSELCAGGRVGLTAEGRRRRQRGTPVGTFVGWDRDGLLARVVFDGNVTETYVPPSWLRAAPEPAPLSPAWCARRALDSLIVRG